MLPLQLKLWLPPELPSWPDFDRTTFGVASTSLCLGDSGSPIGRENEGGRRRDVVVAAAAAVARRPCVPRAQSKFVNGFLDGDGGGGSKEDSASTTTAATWLLPGKKQLEATEASHACGGMVAWVGGMGGVGGWVGGVEWESGGEEGGPATSDPRR